MLHIALLTLLVILLNLRAGRIAHKRYSARSSEFARLRREYDKSAQDYAALIKANADLEKYVQDSIALFDLTKDVCKTLEEDRVFAIFSDYLDKFIKVRDCRFIKQDTLPAEFRDYTVLPLTMERSHLGFLAAKGISRQDEDRFQILAQQFLIGLKRARLYQKVSELAITDSLTQAFSRRYLLERLEEEIKRSKKFKLKCSILMMDLDRFKSYNDNYGHLVGDAILKQVTGIIKENIRQIDFLGRYGGEELLAVLTETDKEQAFLAAERIRKAVEAKRLAVYDEELKVAISVGISTFPQDSGESGGLIDRADKALYEAKQSGRNKVCAWPAR